MQTVHFFVLFLGPTDVTLHVHVNKKKHRTFWLWDNKLHLIGAALHDVSGLAEGHALQTELVERDQSTTWRKDGARLYKCSYSDFWGHVLTLTIQNNLTIVRIHLVWCVHLGQPGLRVQWMQWRYQDPVSQCCLLQQ